TACFLAVSLVVANAEQHEKDHETLILLEIEPIVKSNSKDKRSPQHGSSQAVFAASPGQFLVRTSSPSGDTQAQVQPEYLNLLVGQQPEADQTPPQPVLQQLLIARNPDPSAVQFSNTPGLAPPRRRPPPSLQAQLQQLYFNQQFQQQIPVRPRTLRPPPRPAAPSADDFPAVSTSSQAHAVHEARLRASLAGNDPNLAVLAPSQQQGYLSESYDQQLAQLAEAAQVQLAQAQALPQQFAQVQSLPQQQTAYTISSQVKYVPEPQQVPENPVSYSSRQASRSQQILTPGRVKTSRRPAAAEQYIRETTQPLSDQRLVQIPQRQQNSEPTIYLSSQSGQQTPSASQDNDIISQILSQQGRDFLPSSTPSSAALANVIKSSTSLPSTESRSSIYVTQTSTVKSTQSPGTVTVHEVGPLQEESSTPLPVVHLPTPEGQRPLTQSEFQALINAGFKISPAPESPPQTEAPVYYQQTTKRQRSYVTPAPLERNHVSYQSRQKNPQQEKDDVQQLSSLGIERLQQSGQVGSYELRETKPGREEEEATQYVQPPETQNIPATRIRFLTNKPESEEEIIHFIHIPRTPQVPDVQQRDVLMKYQTDTGRGLAQTHGLEDERERTKQQIQTTRYRPQTQELSYQRERDSLPQQTPSYQHGDESVSQQALRFHPIVVAELPTTTAPSPAPRRRRPRPSHSRAVYRAQPASDQTRNQEAREQYLVSYDSIPEATSFGTRNSRLKDRRLTSDEES
ncbi:hypothetical protein B7P43_G08913, partial [Cryptotermes secundus]